MLLAEQPLAHRGGEPEVGPAGGRGALPGAGYACDAAAKAAGYGAALHQALTYLGDFEGGRSAGHRCHPSTDGAAVGGAGEVER